MLAAMSDVPDCSIVPHRSADPAEVRRLVARDGAAVLTGQGPSEAEARAAVAAVFAGSVLALPDAAAVREGGDKDRKAYGTADALPLHTDGFAYGDRAPDHFGLSCVRQGEAGGESVLVDSYRLLDVIDPELRAFLTETVVDHAEPDMHPAVSPLAIVTAHDRLAVRRVPWVRPAPDDADPARTEALLERWRLVVLDQHAAARRFRLQAGDVAVIDNYRVLHGREPYEGDRLMWRVWVWTASGNGVPAGMLHSDSRYAVTT